MCNVAHKCTVTSCKPRQYAVFRCWLYTILYQITLPQSLRINIQKHFRGHFPSLPMQHYTCMIVLHLCPRKHLANGRQVFKGLMSLRFITNSVKAVSKINHCSFHSVLVSSFSYASVRFIHDVCFLYFTVVWAKLPDSNTIQ